MHRSLPAGPPSVDASLVAYVDSRYPSVLPDFEAWHHLEAVFKKAGERNDAEVGSAARCELNVMSLITREDTLELVLRGTAGYILESDGPYLERRATDTTNPYARACYRLALTYGRPERDRGEAAVDAFIDAVAYYRRSMSADINSSILILDRIIPLLYRLSRRNGGHRMSEVASVVLDAISSSPPNALMLQKTLIMLALNNKAGFPPDVLGPLIPTIERMVDQAHRSLPEDIKAIADLGRRVSAKLNRRDERTWDAVEVGAIEKRLAIDASPLLVEILGARASALHRALGNEARRTGIEVRIREAIAAQEVHEISSSVDITELVEHLTRRTNELADQVGGVGILSYLAAAWDVLVDRNVVRERAEELGQRYVFQEIANTAKRDTDGRIIAHYDSPEEKRQYDYLEQYRQSHRMISMLIMEVLVGSAARSGDLTLADFEKMLSQSWIGEVERLGLGTDCSLEVHLPRLLLPALGLYLSVVTGEANQYQLVLVVDSLAPKFETLIRNLAKRIGIPWMKDEKDASGRVTMQIARLEWLLAHEGMRSFLGEDLYEYLDFILLQPLGDSSRTKVAHGMLFPPEYDLERAHALALGLIRLAVLQPPPLPKQPVEQPDVSARDGDPSSSPPQKSI